MTNLTTGPSAGEATRVTVGSAVDGLATVSAAESDTAAAAVVPREMRIPFVLITLCFAAWGAANNMTDPLVNGFKGVWNMSNLQAALVQSAFYGAYFCLALPAAVLIRRTSYKTGVLVGLGLFILGSLLFFPASRTMVYGHFLVALFVLAGGLSILETSCNPYVLRLGSEATATRRLNLAQAFNPVGSNVGMALAGLFILPNLGLIPEEARSRMPPAALQVVQRHELQAVMGPYVGMAIGLLLLWCLVAVTPMPEAADTGPEVHFVQSVRRLSRNGRYVMGLVAQFFYVGAQICVWTFTLHYVEMLEVRGHGTIASLYAPVEGLHRALVWLHLKPASDAFPNIKEIGGLYLQGCLVLFLVSRFIFTSIMKFVRPTALLAALAVTSSIACAVLVVSPGQTGVWALLLISLSMSIMFPTIYGVALEGVGPDAKVGGAGLVMAILGGALLPLAQGGLIDVAGAGVSFAVPLVCFVVVAAFAGTQLGRRNGDKRGAVSPH